MNPKRPVREALKSLIEQETLNDAQLEALIDREQPHKQLPWYLSANSLWKLSAASCFTLMMAALLFSFYTIQSGTTSIQQEIALEVLTNHLKIKALDIETNSINGIQQYFDRLDFSPFTSSNINTMQLSLLGGRYCTLRGSIAAQLRFKATSGEFVTYYQTLYDKKRFGNIPSLELGEAPKIISERGFKMTLWQESGVVTLLAHTATL